jgi:hypothetical protein
MDSHDDEIKFNHKYITLSPLNKKFYGVSLKNQKFPYYFAIKKEKLP